jgi:hypothetical protein
MIIMLDKLMRKIQVGFMFMQFLRLKWCNNRVCAITI